MSRRRHLENLPPERNRICGELHALAGMTDDSPSIKSGVVSALRDIGVGASWHGTFVYAEAPFAEAWTRVVTRYKTVPLRGVRLKKALSTAAEIMGERHVESD